ncbi:MAG: argininosuccinate lyase [Bacteroidota bacterium]
MKLWQKSAAAEDTLLQKIEAFTIGKDRELDLQLAQYDILGTLAHIRMLEKIGLLEATERQQLDTALSTIHQSVLDGTFEIEEGIEDVHSQVELQLTRQLGDIGKKVHSGRSRNDQVLVDLRLFFRAEIEAIVEATSGLFDTLLQRSEQHKDVLMPGYTHMQVAMVSSFGLWFGAYAEALTDDLQMGLSAWNIINQNPLGSAAGYGNSFPLDRQMTSDLLGFEQLSYNVINAQMGRGKSELAISFAIASLASTLGKLSMDICLYSNQNYNFLSLPKAFTTGSSIMPHKKNPDVFELIRARCNQLQALPNEILLLTSNLTNGYHRDFQLLKENLFPALQHLKDCLRIATMAIKEIQINERLLDDPKYQYLFTVEAVNEEVLKGTPFRAAYQQIGQAIEEGRFQYNGHINHSHEGSIGNLCNDKIQAKMTQLIKHFGFEKVKTRLQALLTRP